MKRQFIEKVLNERIVDTVKYRYVAKVREGVQYVARILIADLDTTSAIDCWTVVWTEK